MNQTLCIDNFILGQSRDLFFEERYSDKYSAKEKFKHFFIPEGTFINQRFGSWKHYQFQVVNDDGKFVTLSPISFLKGGPSFVSALSVDNPLIKVPRKFITSGSIVVGNSGETSRNRRYYVNLPYGIPNSEESSSRQLLSNAYNYTQSLSDLELKQFLAYETVTGKSDVFNSISNGNFDEATDKLKYIYKSVFGTGTSMLFDYSRGKIDNVVGYTRYIPDTKYLTSEVVLKVDFPTIIKTFGEMLFSVENFDLKDLTLPELLLYYRIKGIDLSITNQPGLYSYRGKVFHNTKIDLLDFDAVSNFIKNN